MCAALIETTADRDADDVVADMLAVSMPVVRCRLRCSAVQPAARRGYSHVTKASKILSKYEYRSACDYKPYEKRSIL